MKSSIRRLPTSRSRTRSKAQLRTNSAPALKAVIITNDAGLREEALQLCEKLESRQTRAILGEHRIIELATVASPNNGAAALGATEAARADIVLCYLDPQGYFPLYWKEWFLNWADFRHRPGLFLGRIPSEGPVSRLPIRNELNGKELEAFYQEVAVMGELEFISVTAEEKSQLDWSRFQRVLTPRDLEDEVILA